MPADRAVVTRARRVRADAAPDVFEAFRQVVLGYGVPQLAPLMGVRPGTLYNKADSSEDAHHQPTLRDVVQVTQITGDFRILDALNGMFGRAAFDCQPMAEASDQDLLDLLATLGVANGGFHAALRDGLRERRFTAQALRTTRAEAYDMVAALMTLLRRLEDFVDVVDADDMDGGPDGREAAR